MTQSETRTCQNCKTSFVIDASDFAFYEKIRVPPPTWCPECRMLRRMMWRNERTLYRGICGLCGKNIISMFAPDGPIAVYCHECWFSDKWDGVTYGHEYDFSKPFLVQFHKLLSTVPVLPLWRIRGNVNSDYANYAGDNKNCYLVCSVLYSENVMYSYSVDKSKDCLDALFVKNSELCYESVDGDKNYQCWFTLRAYNCVDSSFLFDCINCRDCFMSSNARNKQFLFRNKQCTREEYRQHIAELNFGDAGTITKLKDEFLIMVRDQAIHRFAHIVKSVGCTGDNIDSSKNAQNMFEGYNVEHAKFGVRFFNDRDVMDGYGVVRAELAYELIAPGFDSSENKFIFTGDASQDIQYSTHFMNSSHLFGCIGLRKRQYYILNKQYTKEEYEELVPRIIEHMNTMPYVDQKGRMYKYGEFFPPELSPFAYNETIAQEYFPLTKEQAIQQGYRWRDPDPKAYTITKKPDQLPDHIRDVDNSILKETIGCAHEGHCTHQCTTAFKVIPEELQFYRRMNLPLPRLCPNCRHYERLAQRNPLKLWHRKCQCNGTKSDNGVYQNSIRHSHGDGHCQNEFETSYAPDRKEIVYCESCYNSEVV